ncbi:hypothetical protein L1887_29473 [Cichorium endivia]|nr:hypothetical protein L1887_29473 [Cichorium endivia]
MSDGDGEGDGGTSGAPMRIEEVGTTSVACPMLTSTNYTVWALRMKVVLRIHKVWTVIDPGTEKNKDKDFLAMGLLYQAIPESLIIQIGDIESSKTLWESIKARYVGVDRVKEARLQTLTAEFDRLRMTESETIDAFAGKMSEIASKSSALGESIEESKIVKKFLKSLPRKFIHIVASLEQVLDLKSVGFEDVVGRLKAYEERVKGAEDDGDGQGKVLFSKSSGGGNSSGSHGGSRGKGTASKGFNGGSGPKNSNRTSQAGKPNPNNQSNNRESNSSNSSSTQNKNKAQKKDMSKIICFRCDKPGHYASKCPDRIQQFQESNFTESDEHDETTK